MVIETTIDRSDLEKMLVIVYDAIKDTIYDVALVAQGKRGFVDSTKAKVTVKLIKDKVYTKIKSGSKFSPLVVKQKIKDILHYFCD